MSYYNWLCAWAISTIPPVPREDFNSAVPQNALWTKTYPHAFYIYTLSTRQHWRNQNLLQLRCIFVLFLDSEMNSLKTGFFVIFWVFSGYNLNQSPLCFFNVIWFQTPIFPFYCWASFFAFTKKDWNNLILSLWTWQLTSWNDIFIYVKPQLKHTMLHFKSWSHHLQFSSFFSSFTHAPIPMVDWNQAFWLQPLKSEFHQW